MRMADAGVKRSRFLLLLAAMFAVAPAGAGVFDVKGSDVEKGRWCSG